uniref:Reverse transcriptase domain-containing protein n=1 Tax=Tanacetum cinerariifolium TaxID=118510 RepID=A0A6L2NE26_TANCI|nr:hypothetical protein [Tanacetum cinerariifolium]
MDQNIDFSGSDQIQNPQYSDIHPLSQENPLKNSKFEAYTNANDANMNDLQFKLDNFQKNQQDFQKKFEQMQDDFQNQMRNFMQNLHDGPPIPSHDVDKEYKATKDTELPSTKNIQPLSVQEPPQHSDMRQLIREECCVEVPEKQKQSIEDTMQELVKICQEKEFLCIHDNVNDLIEIAPILSTKEPEHLLSMRYKHLSITPETESDEVTESNAENLLPISSECEVTLEDKREFYDDDFKDIKYVEALLSDHEIVNVEEENVVYQEEEKIDLEDISQIQDVVLREKILSIIRLISNIESLNDNSTSDHVLSSFESDNSLSENFSPEFETFCDHTKETRSVTTTHANDSLLEYDSFCLEIEPDHERLINLVKNDISDDSSNPLLKEVDLFLFDNSIPPDNPSILRPPPKPPDEEFDFEIDFGNEISVVRNTIVKFECIDVRVKFEVFNDENDDLSYFMFVIFDKMFSLLSAESEDTIFDPGRIYLQ